MNIQPVSMFKLNSNKAFLAQKQNATQPAFKGENSSIDNERINNALKALTLASAVAFTPVLVTSCEKEHICDENCCEHPNHTDIPNWGNGDNQTQKDTVKTGTNYVLPEIKMKRYMVNNGDTITLGNVKFSENIVNIPTNAHKSSELKTVLNFIKAMGLNTSTADKEYVDTRSFAYNAVPAQLTWLDEKTGSANQLKLNGFEKDKNIISMDLVSIKSDGTPVERKFKLTNAGNNRLLVNVFDKEGTEKLNSMFFSMTNDTISKFNVTSDGRYSKVCEYTKGNGNSVIETDRNGKKSKLANVNTIIALAKEED